MPKALHLTVDDDVAELLTDLAGGERRRGQWLGQMVRSLHELDRHAVGSDVEALRIGFVGLAGMNKSLEGRLARVEQQLAAVIANGQQPQR